LPHQNLGNSVEIYPVMSLHLLRQATPSSGKILGKLYAL
jgi:hypothetical protein